MEPNLSLHRTAALSSFVIPIAGCAAGELIRSAEGFRAWSR